MKYLAAAFAIFILAVVLLADQGRLPGFLYALYDFPYGDKLGHFLLMGGLALLANLALGQRSPRLRLLVTLGIAALVALEELSQELFLTRHADLLDLAASLCGIAVAWLICFIALTAKNAKDAKNG